MAVGDELQDALIREATDLLRVEAGLRGSVTAELVLLRERLTSLLATNDPTGSRRALQRLLVRVDDAIDVAYGRIDVGMDAALYQLADTHLHVAAATLDGVVGVTFAKGVSASFAERVVGSQLIEGAPSAEWWSRQSDILKARFLDEMRQGIAQGEALGDLVRRVRGRRENGFKDGIMQTSTQRAEAIVRTSVINVANDARLAVYERNADIIDAIRWVSVLDNRTTPICRALDGKMWTVPDLKPIDHDKHFPGPTAHWNCRSIQVPVLKQWSDITNGALKDRIPQGTRASMDGQVPQETTYQQWLSRQPEALQLEVLGKSRFKLWKSGKLSLEDMTDQRNNPLTLDELRARYGVSA